MSDFAANGSLTEESVLSQLRLEDEDRLIGYEPSARVPGVEQGEPGERHAAVSREAARAAATATRFTGT